MGIANREDHTQRTKAKLLTSLDTHIELVFGCIHITDIYTLDVNYEVKYCPLEASSGCDVIRLRIKAVLNSLQVFLLHTKEAIDLAMLLHQFDSWLHDICCLLIKFLVVFFL